MESSSRSRIAVLAAIAVVLAVVAVTTFMCRHREEGDADSAGAETPLYVCITDGTAFTLTPAEFAERSEPAPRDPELMRGFIPKIRCSKCGQFSAVPAARCPKDQTVVPSRTASGEPARCPQCGGNPFERP